MAKCVLFSRATSMSKKLPDNIRPRLLTGYQTAAYLGIGYGPDGTPRNRSALLSITVCKLAWNVVHRNKPAIVPEVNPFKGVDIDYEPKHNRAATLAELMQFVRAADEDGTLSIDTAALLAYYWLVREEDIFTRMAWSDYRPGEQPNHVLVWHHKNRKSAKIPSSAARCRRDRALARDDGAARWHDADGDADCDAGQS
jgi:hypothetical protein